ncbi:cyclin-like protein [Polychaeton citri CBS 116435]|uniref:RNA polymerase II holoenzyme cyclin-like subunit n=1 Tax=Polychaeton citri CBS 116435 TaxID=1314669 RepID=A0A9P4QDR5_9PEZI|nr:cyclin-like protein [Polychaeton citri CBS 116435]
MPPPPASPLPTTTIATLNAKTGHLPPTQPAARQRPKSPNRVLAEADAQWLFTEAELANTPSIQDGMPPAEERDLRSKGVNFIIQVGLLLKLPQLTLSTAAIFFQRFLMRASLKRERDGIPKLHHYQTAATALFLATKVEESCRKMKDLILACCRVAQKNPNLIIDEQSKDWWRWRDCILHNEDVLLEVLCFDLTVDSPHRQLFELLKYYGVEHNKKVRNAAWGFVTDSNNTQLCLLHNSRTIAVASLYAACRFYEVQLADDSRGRPWWKTQKVELSDVRQAVEYMCRNYEATNKQTNGLPGGGIGGVGGISEVYVGLSASTPSFSHDGADDDALDATRLRYDRQQQQSPYHPPPMGDGGSGPQASGSERRLSNASSVGTKRTRDEDLQVSKTNGDQQHHQANGADLDENGIKRQKVSTELNDAVEFEKQKEILKAEASKGPAGPSDLKLHEEQLRVWNGNRESEAAVRTEERRETLEGKDMKQRAAPLPKSPAQGSEEGELEE